MRKVLITGSNGFIGKHLLSVMSKLNFEVYSIDSSFGDISLKQTWDQLPSSDILIHLAAKSSVPASWNSIPEVIETNCIGTYHALEYCHTHGAKLIFLSSYMYGDAGSLPIEENNKLSSNNPYALSKHFSEIMCDMYRNNFNVKSFILRPFNVYGPDQNDNFLISKLIRDALQSGKVHVKDLEPRRDYVFVFDLISAILKLFDYNGDQNVFNIGSGTSYSVADVILKIEKILNCSLSIENDNIRRPGEIMDSVANINLARVELGWEPTYTLDMGLSEMIIKN